MDVQCSNRRPATSCAFPLTFQDMIFYFLFNAVLIPFQLMADVFLHATNELYHGWKIYDYLVYTRYRFLQRETRWKGNFYSCCFLWSNSKQQTQHCKCFPELSFAVSWWLNIAVFMIYTFCITQSIFIKWKADISEMAVCFWSSPEIQVLSAEIQNTSVKNPKTQELERTDV